MMRAKVEREDDKVIVNRGARVAITPDHAIDIAATILDAVQEVRSIDKALESERQAGGGGHITVLIAPIHLMMSAAEAEAFARELARVADEVLSEPADSKH